jgi:hypothetical protein
VEPFCYRAITVGYMPRFLHRIARRVDAGEEAVGQALLIAAVSIGALSAGSLAKVAIDGLNTLIAALG